MFTSGKRDMPCIARFAGSLFHELLQIFSRSHMNSNCKRKHIPTRTCWDMFLGTRLDYTAKIAQPLQGCWKQHWTMFCCQHCLMLSIVLFSIVEPAIRCNNTKQYCWQHWTVWAAKYCSVMFSTVLWLFSTVLCDVQFCCVHHAKFAWACIFCLNVAQVINLWRSLNHLKSFTSQHKLVLKRGKSQRKMICVLVWSGLKTAIYFRIYTILTKFSNTIGKEGVL